MRHGHLRPAALTSLLALAATGTALAQQDDLAKVEIEPRKVAGSVWMLVGAGGNIGASIGDDGIVLVDDQFAPLVPKIQAALKGISGKPVKFVLNTHWHGDHTGGNEALSASAPILAHDNVRQRLLKGAEVPSRSIPPAPAAALPVLTFREGVTLHVNGEEIRAIHVPNGHTDGDVVVHFTGGNVVHMGDDFVTYGFPFVDLASGGSVRGMIAGLEALMPKLPPDVKVIPGHGDVSTLDDVKAFVAMLKETVAIVEKGILAGKTLPQLQKEKVLAGYGKWSGDFVNADRHLETIYTDLTRDAGQPTR